MYQILVKLSIIYILIFMLDRNVVLSIESDSDYESYVTENNTDFNASDDYDPDSIDEEKSESEMSLIEKLQLLHDNGKNITISKHVNHINDTFEILNHLQKIRQFLFPVDKRRNLEFAEFFSGIDIGLSSECLSATYRIISAVGEYDLWALKFVDAIGRFPPSGFVEGIVTSFGEYEECLDSESPLTEDKKTFFRGQYCLMKVILPYPPKESYKEGEKVIQNHGFSQNYAKEWNLQEINTVKDAVERLDLIEGVIYRLGICIPSVCSAQEFEYMLNKILFPITRIPVEIGPNCDIKNKPIVLDNFQLVSILILTILTILVMFSTLLELLKDRLINIGLFSIKLSNENNLMLSFSLIKNTRSLFAPNTKFAALDTLRLILIIHVHVTHFYNYASTIGAINLKKLLTEVFQKMFNDSRYVFGRSPLMIDALFTLSGFIASYSLLRHLDKSKGRFNYFNFIFQRWIRFVVVVFGSILFFYLAPLSGDGPVWEFGLQWITPGCKNPSVLLKTFLFINNFDERVTPTTFQNCNGPTWFLSALMQLLVIAPIFIITYHRKKIVGIYAIITALIVGLFSAIAPYLIFGIKPYLLLWDLDSIAITNTKSFVWYHMTPNAYLISFFVGIAFGYLCHKKVLFTKYQQTYCWILSVVMISTVYLWHNTFWRFDKSTTVLNALLWLSIGKLLFSSGFGWIYYSCGVGKGGFLNRFLSWHGFQPIARLSFGIYLLHFLVVFHRIFTVKHIYVGRDSVVIQYLIIDIMKDIFLAYIFYLLIEGPFTNISGYLFGRKPAKEVKDEIHLNNNNHVSKL